MSLQSLCKYIKIAIHDFISNFINMFCSAGNKLGKRLEQAGCGVCFRRFGSDRYRMLFIDDLVDNDLT